MTVDTIACVTGASGIVGSRIVGCLLSQGRRVRVLSRKPYPVCSGVELFTGDINDESVLKHFMENAQILFHCAAELKDQSKMWLTNVTGTERIIKQAENSGVKVLCYLSSVGVVGKTKFKRVDELTPCDPQNEYEKSKWEAEKQVARGIKGCKVVILRPTNVVDEKFLGILALPKRSSLMDLCKVIIKGGEAAHIVHAEDVAWAAIYLSSCAQEAPQCYIVSCDNERLNTVAGVWALYKAFRHKRSIENLHPFFYLPVFFPYILRKTLRGKSNMGDTLYSSDKLLKSGFSFKLGFMRAIKQIAESS